MAETLEERDKGWLVGPCDLSKLEVNAVIFKRFPLQQGPKLRPIDDYSMSSINSTVGTHEQATTDNVDVIAAMLVNFMQQLYVRDKATAVVARSFGLSSACRQLCVAESSRAFSYISVFDPTSGALQFSDRYACLLGHDLPSMPSHGVHGVSSG